MNEEYKPGCPSCEANWPDGPEGKRVHGPYHNGSIACESGSIASGGDRSHCTCSICY